LIRIVLSEPSKFTVAASHSLNDRFRANPRIEVVFREEHASRIGFRTGQPFESAQRQMHCRERLLSLIPPFGGLAEVSKSIVGGPEAMSGGQQRAQPRFSAPEQNCAGSGQHGPCPEHEAFVCEPHNRVYLTRSPEGRPSLL
jgi:hypothetical protein